MRVESRLAAIVRRRHVNGLRPDRSLASVARRLEQFSQLDVDSEVLPQNDSRFRQSATSFVLREDKTRAVLWHHENTGAQLTNGCVFHAELAGEYIVSPASVELMYEPDTRGHSGTFHFKVVDEKTGDG